MVKVDWTVPGLRKIEVPPLGATRHTQIVIL